MKNHMPYLTMGKFRLPLKKNLESVFYIKTNGCTNTKKNKSKHIRPV